MSNRFINILAFAILTLLWLGFGTALLFNPEMLQVVWLAFRGWPMVAQLLITLLTSTGCYRLVGLANRMADLAAFDPGGRAGLGHAIYLLSQNSRTPTGRFAYQFLTLIILWLSMFFLATSYPYFYKQ